MAKDVFPGRRATNISKADEENVTGFFHEQFWGWERYVDKAKQLGKSSSWVNTWWISPGFEKPIRADSEKLSLDPKNKEDSKIKMGRDSVDHGNSSFYTIWSSVLFAAVMFSLAAVSFCRRDY